MWFDYNVLKDYYLPFRNKLIRTEQINQMAWVNMQQHDCQDHPSLSLIVFFSSSFFSPPAISGVIYALCTHL